jgi:glycerol kinase
LLYADEHRRTTCIFQAIILLTTIAWQINGKTHYALEGSGFIAGAVVQWLRDGLQLIRSSNEIESLAQQAESTDGVLSCTCILQDFGAPYWNQHARGTIVGITRGTTSAHIARAALESIAFQTMDVVMLCRPMQSHRKRITW